MIARLQAMFIKALGAGSPLVARAAHLGGADLRAAAGAGAPACARRVRHLQAVLPDRLDGAADLPARADAVAPILHAARRQGARRVHRADVPLARRCSARSSAACSGSPRRCSGAGSATARWRRCARRSPPSAGSCWARRRSRAPSSPRGAWPRRRSPTCSPTASAPSRSSLGANYGGPAGLFWAAAAVAAARVGGARRHHRVEDGAVRAAARDAVQAAARLRAAVRRRVVPLRRAALLLAVRGVGELRRRHLRAVRGGLVPHADGRHRLHAAVRRDDRPRRQGAPRRRHARHVGGVERHGAEAGVDPLSRRRRARGSSAPTLLPLLFTHKYDGSVPLFMLATLEIPLWILPLDALLRAAGAHALPLRLQRRAHRVHRGAGAQRHQAVRAAGRDRRRRDGRAAGAHRHGGARAPVPRGLVDATSSTGRAWGARRRRRRWRARRPGWCARGSTTAWSASSPARRSTARPTWRSR